MSNITREPDELWTSYLLRRLEAEGMQFSDFKLCGPYEDTDKETLYSARASADGDLEVNLYRELIVREGTYLMQARKVTYSELREIGRILERIALVENGSVFALILDEPTTCKIEPESFGAIPERCIPAYRKGEAYDTQQTVEGVVDYILKQKPEIGFPALPLPSKEDTEEPTTKSRAIQRRELKEETAEYDPRLDEIIQGIHRLEHIAAEHPLILKSEEAYLRKLYVDTINRDVNALQVFEYQGRRIPYVLVQSELIGGGVGKPSNNLYFVARDIATEDWQQKIVAVHESLCVKATGRHAAARREERKAARLLGKEKEWREWRKGIDKKFK